MSGQRLIRLAPPNDTGGHRRSNQDEIATAFTGLIQECSIWQHTLNKVILIIANG
jgi:hypothetical protein